MAPDPRRWARLALGLVVIAVVAGGYVAAPPAAVSAEEDRPLRYLGSPPGTLDPAFPNDAATVQIHLQLYAGLTRLDETVEPYPSLAESWTVVGHDHLPIPEVDEFLGYCTGVGRSPRTVST